MPDLRAVDGGFVLTEADQTLLNTQKTITKQINAHFIQVGAVYCQPASKNPIDPKWTELVKGDVNLQSWIDDPGIEKLNVGFNLQNGWLDIDIDSPSPEFRHLVGHGLSFVGVDTRFAFGRRSAGSPSHFFVQLNETDAALFSDSLCRFEPKPFKVDGQHYHTQLRSVTPTQFNAREGRQTVMPGSLYVSKTDMSYDPSVWWTPEGKIATSINGIAVTTSRKVEFADVVRGVVFGAVAWMFKPHWVTGTRQATATRITGWLARMVQYAEGLQEHEKLAHVVHCVIDSDRTAEMLLDFICQMNGDEERRMRIRAYYDAVGKIRRNPDAKIPGWPGIHELLGPELTHALRVILIPGTDVSPLTKLIDRYIFCEIDNKYIDLDQFRHGVSAYKYENRGLQDRHKPEVIMIAEKPGKPAKPVEAFKMFMSSKLRRSVSRDQFLPQELPGEIVEKDGILMFNSWSGWPHSPVMAVDPIVMEECDKRLRIMLGYLTRDNESQIDYIIKWLAYTLQYPGIKQQMSLSIVGGQGIGKTFFCGVFLRAIFGKLLGELESKDINSDFHVRPFIEKIIVFADEAKFRRDDVETIRKLIRNASMSGQLKFQDTREYDNFARLVFLSNNATTNITQRDVRDRALFQIHAVDARFMDKTDDEFEEWTETIKPFYEEFAEFLENELNLRHYMHMFMNIPVTRIELESLKFSSVNDQEFLLANASFARKIIIGILESGWIIDKSVAIEMPFTPENLRLRILEECKAQNIPDTTTTNAVYTEMKKLGLTADYRDTAVPGSPRFQKFYKKWGDTIKTFEKATKISIMPYRELEDEDYGWNEANSRSRINRKGAKIIPFSNR